MDLSQELKIFLSFAESNSPHVHIEVQAPYIYKIKPANVKLADLTPKSAAFDHNQLLVSGQQTKKPMRVGLLALVHGNETIGLPILNQILSDLLIGNIAVDYEIYFGIGNLAATEKNVRFVEEDLNRCFGLTNTDSIESARARVLESAMLNHCDYLIDLHQTQNAAEEPFFIFQYSSQLCFQILNDLNSNLPTVVQTDQIGENTGLSTDEYIRSRGGFGTAIELGQKNDFTYFERGLELCRNALLKLQPLCVYKAAAPSLPYAGNYPLYRLEGKQKASGLLDRLKPELKNFSEIFKGQVLGSTDSGPLTSGVDGVLLFPKYEVKSAAEIIYHYAIPTNHAILAANPAQKDPILSLQL